MIGYDHSKDAHLNCGYVHSSPLGTIIFYAAAKKIGRSPHMDESTFYRLVRQAFHDHDALVRNVRWVEAYVVAGSGKVRCAGWEILSGLELHP